jgi:hypothetical protein
MFVALCISLRESSLVGSLRCECVCVCVYVCTTVPRNLTLKQIDIFFAKFDMCNMSIEGTITPLLSVFYKKMKNCE